MTLHLYSSCTAKDAVFSFGGEAQWMCDNQFAVLPNVVLAFVTLGPSDNQPKLMTPSTVDWMPARLNYAPFDEYPWLPLLVREVFDRSSGVAKRIRRHHLFLHATDTDKFVYTGEAHLGSYGGPRDDRAGKRTASFSLIKKLPRELWLAWGRYRGWHLEVNHSDHFLTPENTGGLQTILKGLGNQDYSHFCMTRYEEDSLTIFMNPDCAWLMYLRDPGDCGLYIDNAKEDGVQYFQCACGVSIDVPERQTLPHAKAVLAAQHFFQYGKLPDDLDLRES